MKIMTFEEEKRRDKVNGAFSTLFIVTVFVFLIRLICYFLLEKFDGCGAGTKTSVELLFRAAAIFFPFFIYGKIKGCRPTKKFCLRPTLGSTLLLSGAALALATPTKELFAFLISDGFVFEEPYPAATESGIATVVFLVAVPLVTAAVSEYSLRTVALGSVLDCSHGFSVAAVVICNICLFPEWSALPYTVISAILLSIVFAKTQSTLSVFVASAVSRAVSNAALVYLPEKTDLIFVLTGVAAAVVGLLLLLTDRNLSKKEKPADAFTAKEGFSALFKSSVLYMLIFVSAVQTFYFYAKKPEKDQGEEVRYTVETQKELSFGFTEEKL